MSLLQHGFVGRYTQETYPTPTCSFFDWTIDGSSIEFGDYQSRVCIPNKVVIALTITNCLSVGATWLFGMYLTIREFRLVREWNDTKSFCVFFFVGAIGAGLFAINDILGSPLWNSVGWYLSTIGVCAMEAFTVLVWARITLKIIVIDTEASREELMRWISRVMTWLTAFVCVAIAPLFILRAAWYKFEDPWWYNTMMFFYNLVMLPWYPLFAATVIVFATKLTNLLEESMKTLTTSSFSACKPGGSSIPGTGSHCQKLENDVPSTSVGSRRKILAVTKKIRLVAILVCVDKLGFALSYTTFVVYGGMTMYEPELGMAAYFSYIAMNCLIVFWGCGLFVGCAWYHLRVDNSSDDTMPSTDEVLRRDTVTRESHSPSFRSKSCLVKAPVHAHIHEVIEMQRSPQGH